MSFLKKNCKTDEERQLCNILITKLIPELDSLDFASISKLLEIIQDGMSKYHQGHPSTDSAGSYAAGQAVEHYVKLRLKKENIELMMKEACATLSKTEKQSEENQENSLSNQINVHLYERSQELKNLKKLLSLYRKYKKDLKEFSKQTEILK